MIKGEYKMLCTYANKAKRNTSIELLRIISMMMIVSCHFATHGNIIRPILWFDIFKNANYQHSNMIIPYSIFATCMIYIVCTVVDLLRQIILFVQEVNRNADKIVKPFINLYNRIKKLIFDENNDREKDDRTI